MKCAKMRIHIFFAPVCRNEPERSSFLVGDSGEVTKRKGVASWRRGPQTETMKFVVRHTYLKKI